MKQQLLGSAFLLALSFRSPAQSLSASIDQLAALYTLAESIGHGYDVTAAGLNVIYSIRGAEYSQHESYFTSLETVDAGVTTDKKLEALRIRLSQLITRIELALAAWNNPPISSQ